MKQTIGFCALFILDVALIRVQILTLPEALIMLALSVTCSLFALFGLAEYMEKTD